MRKEYNMSTTITANAPRRGSRRFFKFASLLPAVFAMIFAVCSDSDNSATFDEINAKKVVTFNKNDAEGDAPNTMFKEIDEIITIPDQGNLSKIGYYFVGWSGSVDYYSYYSSYDCDHYGYNCKEYDVCAWWHSGYYQPGERCRVRGDILFTAIWDTQPYTPPSTAYTITLNANGGTLYSSSTVTTGTNGRLSSIPAYPARSGYTCNGWYTSYSGGARITTDYTFYSNTTIYAQWTYNTPSTTTYTITFNANGGTFSGGATSTTLNTGTNGRLSSLPSNPTRANYTFAGWYTSGDTRVTTDYTFYSNTTVYAQWTSNTATTYAITFNANGGTFSGGATSTALNTGTNGKLSSLPSNPTRANYTFAGWYTSGDTRVTTDYTFYSNTTVYAQWTSNISNVYTITLAPNGGTLSGGTSVTTGTNGKLSSMPTDPARNGYTFNGWYTSTGGGTKITTDYTFTSSVTIYAQWTVIPYSITYTLDGGAATNNPATYNAETLPITLNNPTRGGYTFDGWTGSNGTAKQKNVTIPAGSTGAKSYTANWSPIIITFNANGGTVTPASAQVNSEGKLTSANLPTPVKSGSSFSGWTKADGTAVTSNTVFTENITIIAQWTNAPRYNITFNANGGKFEGKTEYSAYTDDNFILSDPPIEPTREGYEFAGWYDASTGGTRVYAEEEGYVFSRSMTIYAHWTLIEEDE